jgi:hypothetical protein
MMATGEDEMLPLDPKCPGCGGQHDATEVFDGSERRCFSCDRLLVCVTYTDGTADMQLVHKEPPTLTGRQQTRARWRRMGRR